MLKLVSSLLIALCLCVNTIASERSEVDYTSEKVKKIKTYRQVRLFVQKNLHRDDTCLDDYNMRVRELANKLYMQPVKMVFGAAFGGLATTVVGTVGSIALGITTGEIEILSNLGDSVLDTQNLSAKDLIMMVMEGQLKEEIKKELLEEGVEEVTDEMVNQIYEESKDEVYESVLEMATEQGVEDAPAVVSMAVGGMSAGAISIVAIAAYHVTKMAYTSTVLFKNKAMAKLIFHGKRGEGRKLKRVAKIVNRRVNRKLKREKLEEIKLTESDIASMIAKADEEGAFCDGSMRRWKRNRKHGAKLRKRLARRSDMLRYFKKQVLKEYGL